MPLYQAPNPYPDFAESSDALVSQPTPSLQASGFTLNQRPSAGNVNWLFRQLGRAVRYLSQGVNAVLVGAAQETDYRLIGGGTYAWNATTGVLSWSDAAYIATPGLADTANTIAAGSVTLTAGQLAYVSANVPFGTTGDTTSGSTTIANLAFESGVVVGATCTGAGIPANATVVSISTADSSITLSSAATASAAGVSLVFATSGPLNVQAVATSAFAPSSNTIVLARCYPQNNAPNAVQVGINSGQMRLLDGEAKSLLGNGYVATMRALAGAAIAAHQPVYLSPGVSDGRSAGNAYPLDVSTAGSPARASFAGIAASAVASGGLCEIVMAGRVPGFGTLTPGVTYYASPSSPTTLQPSAPTTAGQFAVPVGVAVSADVLSVNPAPQPLVQPIGATTSFLGPVSATGFVSGAAFKTVWFAGSVYAKSSTTGTLYGATVLSADGTGLGTSPTNFDLELVQMPVPYAGSIVGFSTYSRGTTPGNASMNITIGGNTAVTANVASGGGASSYTTFPKGQYAFSVGSTLSYNVKFANAGQQNLAVWLWLDIPAA